MNLRWAFAEKPKEIIDIVCHVLPQCTYDLILGSKFLTATETFTKHRRRLVDCVFSMFNVFHLSFLDGRGQTLDGKVGGYPVSAILDTGAERNVMNLEYVSPCTPSLLGATNALDSAMPKRTVSKSTSDAKIGASCNSQTALSRKRSAK